MPCDKVCSALDSAAWAQMAKAIIGAMPASANPLPEGTQLENYRIQRLLATGGFSFVYLAHDENDQPVAIKEYRIAEDDRDKFLHGMRCFFEEGKALTRFSHPNVVRVTNFFRANDTVYLVMRYERGRTLQEHVANHLGPIAEAWVRTTFVHLRVEKDAIVPARRAWAGKYSGELLDIVDWCLRLDHLERPQSVFALQKALLGEKDAEHHGEEAPVLRQIWDAVLRFKGAIF